MYITLQILVLKGLCLTLILLLNQLSQEHYT